MHVHVDSRETRSEVPAWLGRLGYATTTVELALGDYAIGDRVLIERKSAGDFASSILDGRLFGQAELLANFDGFACIILEGSLAALYSRIEPEALAGALSVLALFHRVTMIPTSGAEHTARVIGRLARHSTNGLGYEVALRTAKPKSDGARSQYLVEGLPGVGAETARRLLRHFGSAAKVFSASPTELTAVRGIGPKAAAAIFGALHHEAVCFNEMKGPPLL